MPGVIGGMIERPKMTRSMYQALKRHILHQREKKKQEKEQDEALERQKKERELRKKKAEEESLTLEQARDQVIRDVSQLETKLESLKRDKHELFSQLKKVLHQEGETKKKAQARDEMADLAIQQQYMQQHPGHMTYLQGIPPAQQSKYLRPIQPHQQVTAGIKRPRSPSPPPQQQQGNISYSPYTSKYAGSTYATTPIKQEPAYSAKEGRYGSTSQTHVTYASGQSAHSYPQATAQNPAYARDPPPTSSSKYATPPAAPGAGQSAFSSYAGHYAAPASAHSSSKSAGGLREDHYPAGYRMPAPSPAQQHSYLGGSHGSHGNSGLPLQQQLEHANQKSGFSEEKFKMQAQQIRNIAPPSSQAGQSPGLPPSAQHQGSGSQSKAGMGAVAGYPVRTQASSSNYQPPVSQGAYSQSPSQPARHSYQGQGQGRGYY